jgi:hypothetical protein
MESHKVVRCGDSKIFQDNHLIDGGEVVSLMCRPPFTPGRFLVLISVRGGVDPRATVLLEGLGKLINLITSYGIEPTTFRLIAQCLNQLYYCVPQLMKYICIKIWLYEFVNTMHHDRKIF